MSPRAHITGGHLNTVAEEFAREYGRTDGAALANRFAARCSSFKARAFWLAVAERISELIPPAPAADRMLLSDEKLHTDGPTRPAKARRDS